MNLLRSANSITKSFIGFFFFYYFVCLLVPWSDYIRQKCQPLDPASHIVSLKRHKTPVTDITILTLQVTKLRLRS